MTATIATTCRAAVASALAFAVAAHAGPLRHDWLLRHARATEAFGDERFRALIDATTPTYFSDVGSIHGWRKLNNQFGATLGGVPDAALFTEGRYAVFGGCQPHNCGVEGFLWIDLQSGATIGVLGTRTTEGRGRRDSDLLVFSRAVDCRSIPPAFEKALDAWAARVDTVVESRKFIGKSGRLEGACR